MKENIFMPIGEMAGKEIALPRAIRILSNELLELGKITKDNETGKQFMRYSLALLLIWWQIENPKERDMGMSHNIKDFSDFEKFFDIVLPDDFAELNKKNFSKWS